MGLGNPSIRRLIRPLTEEQLDRIVEAVKAFEMAQQNPKPRPQTPSVPALHSSGPSESPVVWVTMKEDGKLKPMNSLQPYPDLSRMRAWQVVNPVAKQMTQEVQGTPRNSTQA